MTRRAIAFAVFAAAGLALLLGLGSWQVQRMHWKAGILAEMEALIHAPPAALPDAIDPARDKWRAVAAEGRFTGEDRLVMASRKGLGPGWLVVAVFETDGRRVLVDRGFLPDARRDAPRPATPAAITGNLHWPDEVDGFTPAPDPARGLWYARDVPALAEVLDAEPALIVLRTTSEAAPPALPSPLDTAAVPDNHLSYAITWFSLAAIWAVMTMVLLWRMRQPKIYPA